MFCFKITHILQVIKEENSTLFSARTEDYLRYEVILYLEGLGVFHPRQVWFLHSVYSS